MQRVRQRNVEIPNTVVHQFGELAHIGRRAQHRDLDEILRAAVVVDRGQVVLTAQRFDNIAEPHARRVAGPLRLRRST